MHLWYSPYVLFACVLSIKFLSKRVCTHIQTNIYIVYVHIMFFVCRNIRDFFICSYTYVRIRWPTYMYAKACRWILFDWMIHVRVAVSTDLTVNIHILLDPIWQSYACCTRRTGIRSSSDQIRSEQMKKQTWLCIEFYVIHRIYRNYININCIQK